MPEPTALITTQAPIDNFPRDQRHEHPRFVHHSIGYTIVAVLAAATLLFFGPT